MKKFLIFSYALAQFAFGLDPGKEVIGKVQVELIYATQGDPAKAGDQAKEIQAEQIKEIQEFKELTFSSYRKVGEDIQPILRSYESWASPLKPSKEMLLSFEPRQRFSDEKLQLDVEYWQGKRKLLKTDPVMKKGKPLYLLGPEWRGGRLIIMVKIIELKK